MYGLMYGVRFLSGDSPGGWVAFVRSNVRRGAQDIDEVGDFDYVRAGPKTKIRRA